MVRTAVLVSGGGRNLQAIIDSRLFGEIPNCDLAAVISSREGAYALTRAAAANIATYVVDRAVFPNDHSWGEAMFHKLRDLDIELVVLAGFEQALPENAIKHYKNRIINVFPSLLPAFAGPDDPHAAALQYGARITGATAYFVTEEPYSGPIILQQAVEVLPDDTPASLHDRIMEQAEWSILPRAVAMYCTGALAVENGKVKISE